MLDESYVIRPNFKQKFRPIVVQQIINQVLQSRLKSAVYNSESCSQFTRDIADEIKSRLKDMDFPRYKFIVHVVLGELRGEGVKIGARCFWDSDSDSCASDTFMNDSLFCTAAAYGVFFN